MPDHTPGGQDSRGKDHGTGPIYLGIFGVPESKSVPFLREYLFRHGEEGFLREESLLHYGLIGWRTNGQ